MMMMATDEQMPIPSTFPLTVRRKLCSLAVRALTSGGISAILPSSSHIDWNLQLLGAALALPLDEAEDLVTATGALGIYDQLLTGSRDGSMLLCQGEDGTL